jgi:hypothetical protein
MLPTGSLDGGSRIALSALTALCFARAAWSQAMLDVQVEQPARQLQRASTGGGEDGVARHATARWPTGTWSEVDQKWPALLAEAPACEPSCMPVDRSWWPPSLSHSGELVLLPPEFAWDESRRAFLSGERSIREQSDLWEPFVTDPAGVDSRCVLEQDGRKALLIRVRREGVLASHVWFVKSKDSRGLREMSSILVVTSPRAADEQLALAIASTWLGSFRASGGLVEPAGESRGVQLTIVPKHGTCGYGGGPGISAPGIGVLRIDNHGNAAIAISRPGEGSYSGVRTPVIRQWERSDRGPWRPQPLLSGLSAGTFREDDVIDIEPGEAALIGDAGLTVRRAGVHCIKIEYENDPERVPASPSPGLDETWRQRARRSTPITLVSDECCVSIPRKKRGVSATRCFGYAPVPGTEAGTRRLRR